MHKTHSTLSWQHSNFLQQQQHMQTTNQLQSTVINANALPYILCNGVCQLDRWAPMHAIGRKSNNKYANKKG